MNRLKGNLFYKNDKNILDALVQQTPGKKSIQNHLKDRGILLSVEDDKEDIAHYIAPWFTSFFDQKYIVDERSGGSSAKRFSNTELLVEYDKETLQDILTEIKQDSSLGLNINITSHENTIVAKEAYVKPDFSKNVLSQNQPKTAEIEIIKTNENTILIRTNNDEQARKISSALKNKIREKNKDNYEEFLISFASITDPDTRTQFFQDLINNIEGYKTTDMKSVYVSKSDLKNDNEVDEEKLSFIKKVMLNGGSVHQSKELTTLLEAGFYITRIEWTMESISSTGDKIDLYAEFRDTTNCSDFIYALQHVYQRKRDNDFVVVGKSPSYIENSVMLPKIEKSSKQSFQRVVDNYKKNNEDLVVIDNGND